MDRAGTGRLVVALALAIACSSGSGSGDPAAPTLTVTPTEWSVPAGGTPKQFTATLSGSSDAVAWSIETAGTAADVGTLSAIGLYTPPPSLAAGRDVVVKATAGSLVARATVHVGAAVGGVTLSVTPATAAVVAGTAQTVTLHADTTYPGVLLWASAPPLGSIDVASATDATYTAPAFVAADTDVVVTATAGPASDWATITVHPGALGVTGPATVRAGGAAVAFTLVTAVGANAVAWAVTPASAGTISGTGSTGTFTPAASVAADMPFQVIATVGQATGAASSTLLAVPAGSTTVAGSVVDETGAPYAGATVIIGTQSATTDAGGAFAIPYVTAPYDVTVVAEGNRTITVLRGVSDTTPALWFYRQLPGTWRYAVVQGTVRDGGGHPVGATVFGPSGRVSSDATTGAYNLSTSWFGDATATVNCRALGTTLDASYEWPTGYFYGVRPVAVSDTATVTGQDLVIGALASGHVTGTALPGPGSGAPTFYMTAHFSDGTSRAFWERSVLFPSGAYDVVVPAVPDGTFRLKYVATGVSGGSASASAPVVPGQLGVDLAIPAMPVASSPADNALRVGYATPLVWTTGESGGVDAVTIDCEGARSYRITGGGRSATIPDLTAFGIELTQDMTTCSWTPGWASHSVDDQVQGPGYPDTLPLLRTSHGATRSFTF